MTKDELIRMISNAFIGVTLGEGVGLWQAQAMDDYLCEDAVRMARTRDELTNWCLIPADTLNYCESSLSFLDGEGLRFYLPAFMMAEIRGHGNGGVIFALYHCYGSLDFTQLSVSQRGAVRAFLNWCLDNEEYEFEHEEIRRAMTNYWND
jgi:hypothetical protein